VDDRDPAADIIAEDLLSPLDPEAGGGSPSLPPELSLDTPPLLALSPRPYQREALARWLEAEGRGVVVLPTGAGKTVVALMAIEALAARTLVVVPTIELLEQWRAALVERLGVPADLVGVVGGGRRDWRPLTVITYQSAMLPNRSLGGFGLLVFDEVHHLPAEAYRRIPRACGARDKHIAQYVEKRLFVDLSAEERMRYESLVAQYRWYLSGRRGQTAPGPAAFQDLIRRAAVDPAARQALQAHHQARLIALNASAKIELVAQLLERHRTEKVIVFSEYNALVDRISRQLLLPSITYKTPTRERRAVLERFRSGQYSKVVTGRVLNEGVDVPDASVAIVVSGSSATREYIQRLGRVLRPKPTEATLYELITRETGESRSAARRRPREKGVA